MYSENVGNFQVLAFWKWRSRRAWSGFCGFDFFSSSRLIIYSKLLTSCMLLVSFRPGLLLVGLITADRFNWLSCGTIILYTGKRPLIRFKQNVSPWRLLVCDRLRRLSFSTWLSFLPSVAVAYKNLSTPEYTDGRANSIKPWQPFAQSPRSF